jgi:uncharacterized membrane protein
MQALARLPASQGIAAMRAPVKFRLVTEQWP